MFSKLRTVILTIYSPYSRIYVIKIAVELSQVLFRYLKNSWIFSKIADILFDFDTTDKYHGTTCMMCMCRTMCIVIRKFWTLKYISWTNKLDHYKSVYNFVSYNI